MLNKFRKNRQYLVVIIAFLMGLVIYPLITRITSNLRQFLEDLVPEIVGISITVFLVDQIYRNYEDGQLRQRLIRRLGSSVNSVALSAAEELWALQWWSDGALKDAQIYRADLRGVDFGKANLTGVQFTHPRYGKVLFDETSVMPDETHWTPETDFSVFTNRDHPSYWRGFNLRGKDLRSHSFVSANLRGADMRDTDLRNVNLRGADLRGTQLLNSRLEGAKLSDAVFDENTVMPDGRTWTKEIPLSDFGVIG